MNEKTRFARVWISIISMFGIALIGAMVQAATISGTVFQGNGSTPITGVRVEVTLFVGNPWGNPQEVESILTNSADGTYTFTTIDPGIYYLQTDNRGASNYVNEWWASPASVIMPGDAESLTLDSETSLTNINFQLDLGGSISGIVYRDDGTTPLTGVQIQIELLLGEYFCSERERFLYTLTHSSTSIYTLTGIPEGTYYLRSENRRVVNYSNEWWTSTGSLFACNDAQWIEVHSGDTLSGYNFQLTPGATVSGTIYQGNGVDPLSNLSVYMAFQPQGSEHHEYWWQFGQVLDSNGNYSIVGLAPGTYQLSAGRPHFGAPYYITEWWASPSSGPAQNAQNFTVVSGDVLTNLNFQLDAAGLISGHVYQEDGMTPMPELGVDAEDESIGYYGIDVTDQNGAFSIVLPSGSYHVQALTDLSRPPFYDTLPYIPEYYENVYEKEEATAVTLIAPGETTDIDIVLDIGAEIAGTVYQSDGITPATGTYIQVELFQGDPCDNPQSVEWVTTDPADGTYILRRLIPGTYYVHTSNMGQSNYLDEWWASPTSQTDCHQAASITVDLEEQYVGIDFQLDEGGTIAGTVYEGDGTTPVTDAEIWVDVMQGDSACERLQHIQSTSTTTGAYTITGIPAGTYYLQADSNNQSNYVEEWWASPHSTLDCDNAQQVTVTAGGTTSGRNFQLDLGGTITGMVYQSDGTDPVTDAEIWVEVMQGGSACEWLQYIQNTSTTTGAYTITGIPAGTYYLQADNNNQSNYIEEWWASPHSTPDCSNAQQVTVTAGGTTSGRNFQLDLGGAISGYVYQSDGSTPVTGDEIELWALQGDPCGDTERYGLAWTDTGDGSYMFRGLPVGEYYVRTWNMHQSNYLDEWWASSGSEYDCSRAELLTVTAGGTNSGRNFQLDPGGTISGTMYQSNGTTPLTGVSIGLDFYQGDPCGSNQHIAHADTNSADGTYIQPGLPAGTYYLHTNTWDTNYINEWWASPTSQISCQNAQPVTITAGGTASDKNFQLEQGGSISGIVYQSDGTTPITDVSVGVDVFQGVPCGSTQHIAHADTNIANGTYTVTGVPAGTYYLRTYNMEQSNYVNEWWNVAGSSLDCDDAQTVVATSGGALTGMDFQLDLGGQISGTVYQSNGTTPVTGVPIRVRVRQGDPCGSYTGWGSGDTDPSNGIYTIWGVPAGTYHLRTDNRKQSNYVNEWWNAAGSSLTCANAQTMTVTAGGVLTGKNFQLDLGGSIFGTVYQSNGTTPVTDVQIRVRVRQGDPCGSYTTWGDADTDTSNGTYTIYGVPAGTYYLQTDHRNQSNYVNEWWNAAGSNFACANAQTVTVTSGGVLTGKNFQLDLGGQISGTVYQSNGATPVTGVQVRVSVQQGTPCTRMLWVANNGTNTGDGTYTIKGIPAGTYYLQTSNQGQSNYVNEWWNVSGSQMDCTGAQQVSVTFGGVLTGRNFQLDLGGTINGAIYKSDGVTLVTDTVIRVFSMQAADPCGTWQNTNTSSTATGIYMLTGVPVGANYVIASDEYQSGYVNAWWATPLSTGDCDKAQTVPVTVGNTAAGRNFQLAWNVPEMAVRQDNTHIPSGTGNYIFGAVNLGSNASRIFTIQNVGTANLILTGTPKVTISGANPGDFSVTQQPTSPVAANSSATFTVQFTPMASGTRTATVIIANNDADENPYTFVMTGKGRYLTFVEKQQNGLDGVDGLDSVYGVTVSPDGAHVYAASYQDHAVAVFSRNATTGALTFVEAQKDGAGSVNGLAGATAVSVSPDGAHVYVASQHDHAIAVFSRNATTGALTFVEMQQDGVNGVNGLGIADAVTVSPDGLHVYATGYSDNAVVAFSRSMTTGTLSFIEVEFDGINGVDGLMNPRFVIVSPDGVSVYVAGGDDDAIAVFSRNTVTGTLSFVEAQFDGINGVDGLNGIHMVKISPDGAHLYAASYNDNAVAVFQRNVTTGALTFVEMQQHGLNGVEGLAGACAVAVSSDGAHVYTADWDGSSLTVFQRNLTTGALTYLEIKHQGIDDVDGMSNAHDVEVSPDSTHVYAAGAGDDALAVFASRWMPEINVKQGTTNIPSGGSYNFGSVNLGSNVSRVFSIQNIGTTNLTLTGTPRVGISGTHAANFSVTAQPDSLIAPGETTTFTVRFAPTATGTRTATVSIANTDSSENPYTFTVTGTGQSGNAYLLWTK